jgi:hypothetical protein
MDTPFRNLLSYMKDTSEDDIAPFMKKPPRSAFSALQSVVNPRRSQ